MLSHLLLGLIPFAGFAHRNILTRPENFARPVVGRELSLAALDAAGPGTVGLTPLLAPVLGVVLHRAIPEVDDAFLTALASLDHLLLPGPPTLHWAVAGHLSLGLLVHCLLRR